MVTKIESMKEDKTPMPEHEELKRNLSGKFTANSQYLGSFVRQTIMETDFKVLKQINKPSEIRHGDVIVVNSVSQKCRPCVIVKVLKDRTCIYIPLTSTDNIHCMTQFKSRFFGEGCFSRSLSVCSEEFAIENYVGVFDNMKAVNSAIKDFKEFINSGL